jgi:hypothetical protein
MRPMILEDSAPAVERHTLKLRHPDFESMPIETTLRIANKTRNVRFPGRILTA